LAFCFSSMTHFVYILIAQSTGQFYIGQTQDVQQRLHYHNAGRVRSTKNRGPWLLLCTTTVDSRAEAMALERKLKNLKSRTRILNWINQQ